MAKRKKKKRPVAPPKQDPPVGNPPTGGLWRRVIRNTDTANPDRRHDAL